MRDDGCPETPIFYIRIARKNGRFGQESLDVVFTSNFLEHLPDKVHVERTLAQAWRCLKDDGFIICLGPNIKYVPGAYWDFWDHFIPLTELSLSEVLKMKGSE
jgi:predicted SAM-dependent methyltransferase